MSLKANRTDTGHENYDALLGAGAVLSLVLVIALSVYWLGDDARLASAAEHLLAERVARGQAIYASQCTACHGADGEGGAGPALNDRQLLKNTPDEIFFSVIRSGVPNTQMPSWSVDFGGPLTDEDIRDTVAYIRAWEPTAPEILIPARQADPASGALLFSSTCAICHGENGQGGVEAIPALNDPARLQQFDDAWYRGVIANGRPAKGMPTWGTVLSPEQLDDLAALIAAWRAGESIEPSYSAVDLIDRALFALSQQDSASARLHLERALSVAAGPGAEALHSAADQLAAGDLADAQAALQALQEGWPFGDPGAGAMVYSTSCAACHGIQGEGGIGPALQENAFVQEQTNAQLLEFILTGRPGTAMTGFAERLDESELANLIAFLRLWQR